jgi:hypothetical protein
MLEIDESFVFWNLLAWPGLDSIHKGLLFAQKTHGGFTTVPEAGFLPQPLHQQVGSLVGCVWFTGF